MAIIHFETAVREGAPVLISLVGLSSSGKTYSALRLARGLVGPEGKIGVIDTEERRARLYAKVSAPWLWAGLSPPFTPERYVEAIVDAENAGLDCLIIDSCSHEWSGEGGILDMAEENPALANKGLVKWARPKMRHKKFIRKLLRTKMHVITCFRAKRKFVQTGIGKDAVVEERGIVADQEHGFIYEATVQLFLPSFAEPEKRGIPEINKCPGDLLHAFPADRPISEESGRKIREWLSGGAKPDMAARGLLGDAEEMAEQGMAIFRGWWSERTKAEKIALQPRMDNFKSIAAEHDRKQAEGLIHDDEPSFDGDDAPPFDAETGEVRADAPASATAEAVNPFKKGAA
jgi:hypothetical protein